MALAVSFPLSLSKSNLISSSSFNSKASKFELRSLISLNTAVLLYLVIYSVVLLEGAYWFRIMELLKRLEKLVVVPTAVRSDF